MFIKLKYDVEGVLTMVLPRVADSGSWFLVLNRFVFIGALASVERLEIGAINR